jgi:hypothetical protein
MLTITLQRQKNIRTAATRPGSDITQWKTTVSTLRNKEKHKGNKKNKNNAANNKVVKRKPLKVIIVIY